jgi:ATP-dependent DNA ligase
LKAAPQSVAALKKIDMPAYGQIKADGMRGEMFFIDGVVTTRSRNGKHMDLLGIFDYLQPMCDTGYADEVVDGEFTLINPDGTKMSRQKGNAIINKSIRGTISPEEVAMIQFTVWDLIPIDEFFRLPKYAPPGSKLYDDRFSDAGVFVDTATDLQPEDAPNTRIELSENRIINNLQEADEYYEEAAARGEEGIILKNIKHPYENRKGPHLVKYKAVRDCELEVIGHRLGKVGTKLEGKLGSLIGASRDRGVISAFSGFTDKQREEIWNNLQDWEATPTKTGKIVAVEYNERSRGHGSEPADALDHAYFLEERLDKSVADHSRDIK